VCERGGGGKKGGGGGGGGDAGHQAESREEAICGVGCSGSDVWVGGVENESQKRVME